MLSRVKTEWWDVGVVMCLGQGVDLHMVQLMPLPLTVSCSGICRLVLPFWCRLTRVVPDKIQEGCKTMIIVRGCSLVKYNRNKTPEQLQKLFQAH